MPPSLVSARPASQPPPKAPPALTRGLVLLLAAATLLPWVSSGLALVAGIVVALTLGNPWPSRSRALARRMLTWSVIGLGAGMDLRVVGRVGLHGLGYTAVGIAAALGLGTLLGRRLGVGRDASLLVTVGTAICGGSAIAAVAPTIDARDEDVSLALVTVFLLNAVALFAFPAVGHALRLPQEAFGLWCALAIHDTSSVVGAAASYGERALEIATAAKLARALWIVPVTFGIALHRGRSRARLGADEALPAGARPRAKLPPLPWFIAGFLLVAGVVTAVPSLRGAGHLATAGAHRLLALTLFLMGLGLSRGALRTLGVAPLVQAGALWLVLATGTLGAILAGVIV